MSMNYEQRKMLLMQKRQKLEELNKGTMERAREKLELKKKLTEQLNSKEDLPEVVNKKIV